MNGSSRRFIFNRYRLPQNVTSADIYANDPVVQLDEGRDFLRNQRQLDCLHTQQPNRVEPTVPGSIFGESLDWAYREYIVHRLSPLEVGDQSNLPLGIETTRPTDAETRRQRLSATSIVRRPPTQDDLRLCLFNVLVALEWYPSRRYLCQLEWAFRRASDFFYDATDGRMAFGQVIFGGPEWLNCADIQIMASNRLLPRAWVSGLHDSRKYMPIRAGRGVWHKENHVIVAWDEPEAYRTLVHEWAHYALELRDEYLERHDVFPPAAINAAGTPSQFLTRGNYALIVPKISLAVESIMATLQGTSELVPQIAGNSMDRRLNVWQSIKENGHFPFLDSVANRAPLDGPGRLPLPLPSYGYLGALTPETAPQQRTGAEYSAGAQLQAGMFLPIPTGIQPDHCWVYLIQGMLDKPSRVIAQGTLEARSVSDGFWLIGANQGDHVVLVGSADQQTTILVGTISGVDQQGDQAIARIADWEYATPTCPIIDVIPGQVDPADPLGQISVRIIGEEPRPNQVWVFPLGQLNSADIITLGQPDTPDWTSAPQSVPTLDGHVLARWHDGKLLFSTFSQGGGPYTHIPAPPNAITGGSSEGNVMLFFENLQSRDYSAIRVVTTLIHGMPTHLPSGAQARSYAFSIASNAPLPTELSPTLVMYFDSDALSPNGDLAIYRQVDAETWTPLPSYQPLGASYIAAPLNSETASRLVAIVPQEPRVERYRLYWTPRNPVTAAAGVPSGSTNAA